MTFRKLKPSEFEMVVAATSEPGRQRTRAPDSTFIRSLAAMDRQLLAKLIVQVECSPGDIILNEGDAGDVVYLIRSGRVAVLTGDFMSPVLLGRRGPGEVLGEMSPLEDRPRSASVIALENVRLLKIDATGFKQMLEKYPAAGIGIMASLSARLREAATVRNVTEQVGRELVNKVSMLQSENQELLELQRVRQETSSLIIHDLRSPLGLMYSAIQMLEVILPEDQIKVNWELFDVIRTSYARMQHLVESLLDVARMESGEVPLQLAATSLKSLVDEALAPSQFELAKRNIEHQIAFPDGVPEVMVDKEMMIRVLYNLIDNAIKYMPGGGKLVLSARQQQDHIVIDVTDTGPGIPGKERERIFERFTQASGGDRPRGFGLGLVFCRLTVEAHGGRIWVEPGTGGIGSRFVFTLPLGVGPVETRLTK